MQPLFTMSWVSSAKSSQRHLRVECLLDVADVGAVAVRRVDEGVDVAELQLDGGAHVVVAHDLREVGHDPTTAVDAPQVVVGQLENEEVLEDVAADAHELLHDSVGVTNSWMDSRMKSIIFFDRPGYTPIQKLPCAMRSALSSDPTTRCGSFR